MTPSLLELAAQGGWEPATVAAGCEGAGFHDLRRANATALVTGGVDVKTAQVRLGHRDPRLTIGICAQAVPEVDRLAAEKAGETGRRRPFAVVVNDACEWAAVGGSGPGLYHLTPTL